MTNKQGYDRAYRSANIDRIRELGRRNYAANKEKRKAYGKARYEAKKAQICAWQKEYNKANAERVRAAHKSYYTRNKVKIAAQMKAWKLANRDKVNANVQRLFREHPERKLLNRLRTRVIMAVKTQATQKAFKTEALIGCSVASFRIYIESKFEPGMTWENIHLDHIIPCALFDLKKPEHQKICFHFSNYQPLFVKDNLEKGALLFHEPGTLRL